MALGFSFTRKTKNKRKSSRRTVASNGWIRLEGFATRPCRIVDLSDTGMKLALDPGVKIPNTFTLLLSRDGSAGRRARVIWRRGSQIGAEFI